jgi:hypothetical protein
MGDQQGATRSRLPKALEAVYFRDENWAIRLEQRMAVAGRQELSAGNRHVCLDGPPSLPATPQAVPGRTDAAEAAPPQADRGHFRSEPPRQSLAFE